MAHFAAHTSSAYSSLEGANFVDRLPGPVPTTAPRSAYGPRQTNRLPFSPERGGSRIRVPVPDLTPFTGRLQVWPLMTIPLGVRFHHVQQGYTHAFCAPGDFVFPPVRQGRAEFRILWPGYAHMERTFNIPMSINHHPIKRWELAQHVVMFYAQFWEQAQRANVFRGNEHWDIKRFDWNDLVLVSISNQQGHDAVFQAVVEAARP